MNGAACQKTDRLAELRDLFDRAFAAPRPAEAGDPEVLIAIRLAGEALALKARHIAGLAARKRIVPLPGRVPELLGVAAIRGALVPVYSLAAFLGFPARSSDLQWLALANRDAPIALAFEELEGRVDVPRASLYAGETHPAGKYTRELAQVWSCARPVVDVLEILKAIQQRAGVLEPAKE